MACLLLCVCECVSVSSSRATDLSFAVTQIPVKGQLKPFITWEPAGLMYLRDPISRGPVSGPEAHTDFCLCSGVCTHMHIHMCNHMCMPVLILRDRLLATALT